MYRGALPPRQALKPLAHINFPFDILINMLFLPLLWLFLLFFSLFLGRIIARFFIIRWSLWLCFHLLLLLLLLFLLDLGLH